MDTSAHEALRPVLSNMDESLSTLTKDLQAIKSNGNLETLTNGSHCKENLAPSNPVLNNSNLYNSFEDYESNDENVSKKASLNLTCLADQFNKLQLATPTNHRLSVLDKTLPATPGNLTLLSHQFNNLHLQTPAHPKRILESELGSPLNLSRADSCNSLYKSSLSFAEAESELDESYRGRIKNTDVETSHISQTVPELYQSCGLNEDRSKISAEHDEIETAAIKSQAHSESLNLTKNLSNSSICVESRATGSNQNSSFRDSIAEVSLSEDLKSEKLNNSFAPKPEIETSHISQTGPELNQSLSGNQEISAGPNELENGVVGFPGHGESLNLSKNQLNSSVCVESQVTQNNQTSPSIDLCEASLSENIKTEKLNNNFAPKPLTTNKFSADSTTNSAVRWEEKQPESTSFVESTTENCTVDDSFKSVVDSNVEDPSSSANISSPKASLDEDNLKTEAEALNSSKTSTISKLDESCVGRIKNTVLETSNISQTVPELNQSCSVNQEISAGSDEVETEAFGSQGHSESLNLSKNQLNSSSCVASQDLQNNQTSPVRDSISEANLFENLKTEKLNNSFALNPVVETSHISQTEPELNQSCSVNQEISAGPTEVETGTIESQGHGKSLNLTKNQLNSSYCVESQETQNNQTSPFRDSISEAPKPTTPNRISPSDTSNSAVCCEEEHPESTSSVESTTESRTVNDSGTKDPSSTNSFSPAKSSFKEGNLKIEAEVLYCSKTSTTSELDESYRGRIKNTWSETSNISQTVPELHRSCSVNQDRSEISIGPEEIETSAIKSQGHSESLNLTKNQVNSSYCVESQETQNNQTSPFKDSISEAPKPSTPSKSLPSDTTNSAVYCEEEQPESSSSVESTTENPTVDESFKSIVNSGVEDPSSTTNFSSAKSSLEEDNLKVEAETLNSSKTSTISELSQIPEALISSPHNSTPPIDSKDCCEDNWSEAGPVTAAEEIFEDPSAFDFLVHRGANTVDANNLYKKSLFVKFDPLVNSPSQIERKITASLKMANENSDEKCDLKSLLTPLKNPASETVGKLINSPDVPALADELSNLKALIIKQEKEFQEKLQLKERNEAKLKKELNEKTKNKDRLSNIMNEYEKTISQMVAQKEVWDSKLQAVENERDTTMQHLNNLEIAFNDVHQKYERSKTVIENLKKNEDILKASVQEYDTAIKKQENKYEMLKQHAKSQLDKANQELDVRTKSSEAESAKLRALLKKSELRNSSLEQSLEQKTKENQELMKICDELINKVGQTS